MLRFKKKAVGRKRGQIFVLVYRINGRENKVGKPDRRSTRLADDFDWLGGQSSNHEAPEVSLRGS